MGERRDSILQSTVQFLKLHPLGCAASAAAAAGALAFVLLFPRADEFVPMSAQSQAPEPPVADSSPAGTSAPAGDPEPAGGSASSASKGAPAHSYPPMGPPAEPSYPSGTKNGDPDRAKRHRRAAKDDFAIRGLPPPSEGKGVSEKAARGPAAAEAPRYDTPTTGVSASAPRAAATPPDAGPTGPALLGEIEGARSAKARAPGKARAAKSKPAEITTVPVLFGTDRARVGTSKDWNTYFGTTRGDFVYGIVNVTIPPEPYHIRGQVSRPPVFWRIRTPEHPYLHVTIQRIEMQKPEQFFSSLKNRLGQSRKNQAFVYVHGFNNSFADAAHRTAQLAFDLEFQGVPIFYSWPSLEYVAGYPGDERTARASVKVLSKFLDDVLDKTPNSELFLVAHSMGNLALTNAFVNLASTRPDAKQRIKELILVAPDIDTEEFDQLAAKLASSGAGVTIYASKDDRALVSSREFRSGFSRVGELSSGAYLREAIDVIDATGLDTSFTRHAYFLIPDLIRLINMGHRARERGLVPVQPNVWRIKQP